MKKNGVYLNVSPRYVCLFFSLLIFQVLLPQPVGDTSRTGNNKFWYQELENYYQDSDIDNDSWAFLIEELNGIYFSGININQASREDLERLLFLSSRQIEEIVAYLYFNHGMKTLGELQLIPGLDYQTRSLLKYFLYAGQDLEVPMSINLRDIARYGRNEIVLRSDIPFYYRAGYKAHSVEELSQYPDKSYLGGPLAHSIRYSFNYKNRVRFGLLAENDAGEPFFKDGNRGYDYYSPYLYFSDIYFLKCLALGKFKAGFGRGLVLNTGFSLGKSFSLSNMNRSLSGIKPHSSLSEYGYFRGVGVTIKTGRAEISALCSRTAVDATLFGNRIKSIKNDGYHRTLSEYSKKGNTNESVVALHVAGSNNGIHIGSTAQYVAFDRYFAPGAADYQRYSPVGYEFFSAGLDYSIFRPRLSFSGEVALSDGGGFATINSMITKIGQGSSLVLLQRIYSPKYHSFHSSSFAEGSVTNEAGIYAGFSSTFGKWDYDAYIDLFYFPFLRYAVSSPSNGLETRTELARPLNSTHDLTISYKYKAKQSDTPSSNSLAYKKNHRCRISLKSELSGKIKVQSQFHYVGYCFANNPIENGLALSESVNYSPAEPVSLSVSTTIFFTDSYESSISAYEKGLLYAFNYQTFSGRGLRLSAILKFNMAERLFLIIKAASICYFDRSVIGSSRQSIDSNHKEDLYIQIRYKY